MSGVAARILAVTRSSWDKEAGVSRFRVGVKYRVVYRFRGVHRKNHVFVGVFLHQDQWGGLQFSLRPSSGTSTLGAEHIVSAEEVPDGTACGILE